jgi:hypothetical protein
MGTTAIESTGRRREEVVRGKPFTDAANRRTAMLFGVTSPAVGVLLKPATHVPSFSPNAIASDRESRGFRWEADMTALVADQVHRLMPRGGAHLVVGEVPAAQGIADIVAVRFDIKALRTRLDSGIGPVTSPLRVKVLHALREDRSVRISTLAAHVGTNASALTRSTLKPLAELGLVELRKGTVRSTGAWRPVAAHLTAVELKLSKWRDALRQADNFAVSADRAWVVLDASRSAGAVRESTLIGTFGVGLAVIESTGQLQVVVPPRGRRPERWLRALMAEQVWAAAEGEVATAFAGVRLHESTPAVEMPRLDARGEKRRETVAESDGRVEAVGDESATVSDGHSSQRRSLFGRVANLVTFGEREVMRSAHLSAIGTGARLVSSLVHELLVEAPRHVAEELGLEVWEGSLLGRRHRRGEPIDPRPRGHAAAESPSAPAHGEPTEPA